MFRDAVMALPRELTMEQNIKLVTAYVQKENVSQGIIADPPALRQKVTFSDYLAILADERTAVLVAPDYGLAVRYVRKMRAGDCAYWPGSPKFCRRHLPAVSV